ncbi:DUF3784 domain-containing protein [Collinsella intestinalis]|uniref:DUF3784 domain-containing protein n=1 Tax=Collinsella intestinalis TaxID=147207 RepID=UPI00344469B4
MRGSEMPGVFVCAAIAVLCLALAIVLLTGRGAFLVVGYNMATPEERALYDERKLSRSAASGGRTRPPCGSRGGVRA